jgi:hypothetical protein
MQTRVRNQSRGLCAGLLVLIFATSPLASAIAADRLVNGNQAMTQMTTRTARAYEVRVSRGLARADCLMRQPVRTTVPLPCN